jgi:hypothetical protein
MIIEDMINSFKTLKDFLDVLKDQVTNSRLKNTGKNKYK